MSPASTDALQADATGLLQGARRVVVKIGSALVVDRETGRVRDGWLQGLADDIAAMRERGQQVIVVSSGAIAVGRHLLKLSDGVLDLEQSQAAAAVGQIRLAHIYQSIFEARGLVAGQILVTLTDTEERRRYLNARRTIETLLANGAVPVVNENDTVATSEIRYGDNDRLSARVASMMSADCLVLLSDVDGLYTAAPERDAGAEHIAVVRELTPQIVAMAEASGNPHARGGMVTKLEAARIAMAAGTHLAITSGKTPNPLKRLRDSARATWFIAKTDPVAARKRWISGQLAARGTLAIDAGAVAALRAGKSLL
ncbi:MAG: glutamate 5-kinase, partial [Pseudomonadota bacterium]